MTDTHNQKPDLANDAAERHKRDIDLVTRLGGQITQVLATAGLIFVLILGLMNMISLAPVQPVTLCNPDSATAPYGKIRCDMAALQQKQSVMKAQMDMMENSISFMGALLGFVGVFFGALITAVVVFFSFRSKNEAVAEAVNIARKEMRPLADEVSNKVFSAKEADLEYIASRLKIHESKLDEIEKDLSLTRSHLNKKERKIILQQGKISLNKHISSRGPYDWFNIGHYYYYSNNKNKEEKRNNLREAARAFDYSMPGQKNAEMYIRCLINKSLALYDLGENEAFIYFIEVAQKLAEEHLNGSIKQTDRMHIENEEKLQACYIQATFCAGVHYMKEEKTHQKAIFLLKKSADYAKKHINTHTSHYYLVSLFNIGVFYGKYKEDTKVAINCYMNLIKNRNRAEHDRTYLKVVNGYQNLTSMQLKNNLNEEAMEYCKQGIEYANIHKLPEQIPWLEQHLSEALYALGDKEKAIELAKKIVSEFQHNNDQDIKIAVKGAREKLTDWGINDY